MAARRSKTKSKKSAGNPKTGKAPSRSGSLDAHHREWLNLIEIEGPFLSIPVLKKSFPNGLDNPSDTREKVANIRLGLEEWELGLETGEPPTVHADWIDFVLRYVLDLDDEVLRKAGNLPPDVAVPVREHGEVLSPDFVVVEAKDAKDEGSPRLLVQVLPPTQDLDAPIPGRRWKASPSERMAEMLRGAGKTGVPIGLLTNGSRWMLVHAPRGETVGKATWDATLWAEEDITLRAFRSLLGLGRFFVEPEERLEALLQRSAHDQQELTEQLGAQVRRAVEVIVQSFDRLDRTTGRKLLEDVEPRTLYEASVTVMMRLVFLLYAEEQLLLPLEDPLYSRDYSASKLLDQLQEDMDRHGAALLERRHSAWSRLLATFRAVHGGVEHESMRLPAYGGSLFDPDRFPFLEGRPAGSHWRAEPAHPIAIDDYTVLQIMGLLQYLGSKAFDGQGTQAVRLSFKGLGVEQIGHVYEGLLDHTAVRATEPVLGLIGPPGLEPEVPLSLLEMERRKGDQKHFVSYLEEVTRKSQRSIEKALACDADNDRRWIVACDNDAHLVRQVGPYIGVVREDPSGRPVVMPRGSIYVTQGSDRRSTGAHYTPPSLTEPIVKYTLEPLVYEGPAEGRPEADWKLRPPRELLALRVCDLAMGSGAFLVAACRYLAERLVEAWELCEQAQPGKVLVSPEGDLSEGDPREALVPADPTERLATARRFVADRCLYGVDKDPMAVEMGKLSLWLVTLQKGKPFSFLDHALKSGDSLLGVSRREQLEAFDLSTDGTTQLDLFGALVGAAMATAREKRVRLEALAVNDVRDAEEKASLLAEVDAVLAVARQAGDLLTAVALSTAGESASVYATRRRALAERFGRALDRSQTDAERLENLVDLERHARKLMDEGRPATEPARKPFHWPLEFPEVFESGGFDAFVGNPPFIPGRSLGRLFGDSFKNFLTTWVSPGGSANADLVAFFFCRAATLVRARAALGLIATKSIGEGDSRTTGLQRILEDGIEIFRMRGPFSWPGQASVLAVALHLFRGGWHGKRWSNDLTREWIGSDLSDQRNQPDAKPLVANKEICFQGSVLAGDRRTPGFILSTPEAESLLKVARNREVIRPYLIGDDINDDPKGRPGRWVIDFSNRTLAEAETFPECLELVRMRVKPHRDTVNRKAHRDRWWQFGDTRPALYAKLLECDHYFVQSRVSKYICIRRRTDSIVIGDAAVVYPGIGWPTFSILQSFAHEEWSRRPGVSALGGTPRYVPRDCIEKLALPPVSRDLGEIGQSFHDYRDAICEDYNEGPTEIYNRFHDQGNDSEDIFRLRDLQVELDQAVSVSYGWDDLDLGHDFHETDQGPRFTVSPFARREVLDRLLELNNKRYADEVARGLRAANNKPNERSMDRDRKHDDSRQVDLFDSLRSGNSSSPLSSEAVDTIVDTLKVSGVSLSKSELLQATGIHPNAWSRAIRDALESGRVSMQGERRGARYSISTREKR